MGVEKENARRKNMHTKGRMDIEAGKSKTEANIHDVEAYFQGLYRDQLEKYDLVKVSSFYLYKKEVDMPEGEEVEQPATEWGTIDQFYHTASSNAKRFYASEVALQDIGEKLAEKEHVSVDEMITAGNEITTHGSQLTRDLIALNDTPATPGKHIGDIHKTQQFVLKKVCKEIGSDKPEEFRETMRRYIPRWMWEPLSPPDTEVPLDYQERFRELWRDYTPRQANLLIHPDKITEGKAPLHMAFKTASEVEKDGQTDLGYAIKTSAVTDLLAMEKERAQQSEQPFFTYVFGGAMTGEGEKPLKNTHFNYQAAITGTMRETFSRLSDELEDERRGPATEFVDTIAGYYPHQFPELFARSLFTQGRESEKLDTITLLNNLQQRDSDLATGVIAQAEKVGVRRALTAHEVTNYAQYLPESAEQEVSPAACIENAAVIAGDELAYGFTDKVRDRASGKSFSVSVELDTLAESVTAKIGFNFGDKIRYVPFRVSFSGEKESLQLNTLGTDQVTEEALEKYRNVVVDVIGNRAEKIREKEKKATGPQTERPALKISGLTREERMRLYAESKGKTEKRKQAPPEKVVFQRTTETSDEQRPEQEAIMLHGLDHTNVSQLLADERIEVVTAAEIIEKVETMTEAAKTSKKMLGKKINLRERVGPQAEGINLRQLNWSRNGGLDPIRIYLQDIGSGTFVLRGILNKKGLTQQTKYMKSLTQRIIRERTETTE